MTERADDCILEVGDLTIDYEIADRIQRALEGITFRIARGETVGVLGESGSGKSTLALALLRVLPRSARIVHGTVRFEGHDLLALSDSELKSIRGSKISLIFQEPDMTLNPVMRAIDQVVEVIAAHNDWSRERCRSEAERILADVRLDPTSRILSAYPHQLSGGQRQRLAIAQALACRPALLIADEPTAALDLILQVQWLSLIQDLRKRFGLSLVLITHDPAILAGLADRVLVMYRGRIVEEAGFEQMMRQPLHPYTRGLLNSLPPPPGLGRQTKKTLPTIPGSTGEEIPMGCPFAPRCNDRRPECQKKEPPNIQLEDGRRVRCLKYGG